MLPPEIGSYNLKLEGDLEVLAEALSHDDSHYGDGMDILAISYLTRQCAIEKGCSFFDAYLVNGKVNELNAQLSLAGQNASCLLVSPINVYADGTSAPSPAHDRVLENTLRAICSPRCRTNFDKVFIPIGCQERGKAGHNIALVLERNGRKFKALIFDQLGGGAYADTKMKIAEALNSVASDVESVECNRYPMTSRSRNDCATVTSIIRDCVVNGENMRELKDDIDACGREGQAMFGREDVDEQHRDDKEVLRKAANMLAANIIIDGGKKGRNYRMVPEKMVDEMVRQHRATSSRSAHFQYGRGQGR